MCGPYALVGCPKCPALFIVSTRHSTTECPGCDSTVCVAALKPRATGDRDELSDERGRRLAERWHKGWGEAEEWQALIAGGPTAKQLDAWPGIAHPHAAWWREKEENRPRIEHPHAAWWDEKEASRDDPDAELWAHAEASRPRITYPDAKIHWHQATRDPARFYRDSNGCLSPAAVTTPEGRDRVVEDRPLQNEEELLNEILRDLAGPVPVLGIARDLFGPGVSRNGADAKWTKRHCEKHPRVEDVRHLSATPDSRRDETEPSESLFLFAIVTDEFHEFDTEALDQQVRKNPDRGLSGGVQSGGSGDACDEMTCTVAQANARTHLRSRQTIDTAEQCGNLVGAFGGYLTYRYAIPESDRHPTLFTDMHRALCGVDRVRDGFAEARNAGHREGVFLTVTTNPKEYASIWEQRAGLYDDVAAVRERIGEWVGAGRNPDYVMAVEPMEAGMPHAHMVVFDPNVGDVVDGALRERVSTYWAGKRGEQVGIAPIVLDSGEDEWLWQTTTSPPDVEARSPVSYLSKGASSIASVSALTETEVLDVAAALRELGPTPIGSVTDEIAPPAENVTVADVRWAAWYWATGLQVTSRSQSFSGPTESRAQSATA